MISLNQLKRFLQDEEGITAIEYGLVASLMAVVITALVITVDSNFDHFISNKIAISPK
ncbi:MAG TPA: Flp family type IVb pilin [Azonexus sp.]|nr:Flp family type IVb pilin [Azonexus sp.]